MDDATARGGDVHVPEVVVGRTGPKNGARSAGDDEEADEERDEDD